MLSRLVVLFFTVLNSVVFAQTSIPGFFGPVSTRLKAGDPAPDLQFGAVLSTPPGARQWTSASLSGQTTVLVFFPDTSHNPQSVTQWNELIEQMSGKPVQFVWITGEKQETLGPFLSKHPLKGWMFLDADGESGRSYGMETPQLVMIGPDRRIIGFDMAFVPQKNTVMAALDGRITTTPPKPGQEAIQEFVTNGRVLLQAQPHRMPAIEDHKPAYPPSDTLHITPAKSEDGGDFSSDDFKSLRGFDLKGVIAELYHVSPIRIHLPASLDDGKRYDFDLVLPKPESRENIQDRFRRGIQEHFQVNIAPATLEMDAYVLTAPDPQAARHNPAPEDDFATFSSVQFEVAHPHDQIAWPPKGVSLANLRGIGMRGAADELAKELEQALDRPVVNETDLQGAYDFHVKTERGSNFLDALRSQLGLAIAPASRPVEILQVTPR